MNRLLTTALCASTLLFNNIALADEPGSGLRADSHAPISIMGDHMHNKGEWMTSYRFMSMDMQDNLSGSNRLSVEEIATTAANRFADVSGQPPTLRVVPTKMHTDMHMFGGMYAPSDNITLMVMASYLERDMDLTTFQGGMGIDRLGTFNTKTEGWGDVKVASLIRLYKDQTHQVHLNAGLSLPTGSISETDQVLTPMGMQPTVRLPYAMQLGSGTYDLLPGISYLGFNHNWGWGAQANSVIHLGKNSQDYSLGDKHSITAWGSYLFTPAVSVSLRVAAETESRIDGIDDKIVLPVQSADPENYGGQRISTTVGINTVVTRGLLRGHRFSVEFTIPNYQDVNGPQLERDKSLTLGWTKAF